MAETEMESLAQEPADSHPRRGHLLLGCWEWEGVLLVSVVIFTQPLIQSRYDYRNFLLLKVMSSEIDQRRLVQLLAMWLCITILIPNADIQIHCTIEQWRFVRH